MKVETFKVSYKGVTTTWIRTYIGDKCISEYPLYTYTLKHLI